MRPRLDCCKCYKIAVLNGTCQGDRPDSLRAGRPGSRVDIRPALELIEEASETDDEVFILRIDLFNWAQHHETGGYTIRQWPKWNALIDRVVGGMSTCVAELRKQATALESHLVTYPQHLAKIRAEVAAGEFDADELRAMKYGHNGEEMAHNAIQTITAYLEKVLTTLDWLERRLSAYIALRMERMA